MQGTGTPIAGISTDVKPPDDKVWVLTAVYSESPIDYEIGTDIFDTLTDKERLERAFSPFYFPSRQVILYSQTYEGDARPRVAATFIIGVGNFFQYAVRTVKGLRSSSPIGYTGFEFERK